MRNSGQNCNLQLKYLFSFATCTWLGVLPGAPTHQHDVLCNPGLLQYRDQSGSTGI